MSQENNTSFEQEEQVLSIRELWTMCVARWPWFVGSVLLCLIIASIYILKTPPVYTRQASILIKESPRRTAPSEMSPPTLPTWHWVWPA